MNRATNSHQVSVDNAAWNCTPAVATVAAVVIEHAALLLPLLLLPPLLLL
jgi:hypothetical protein